MGGGFSREWIDTHICTVESLHCFPETMRTLLTGYACMLSCFSCVRHCETPTDYSLPGFLCPRDSPGKNTGVGCHALLQRTSLTQRWNPGLHCRQILYHLSHQESPFIPWKQNDKTIKTKTMQWTVLKLCHLFSPFSVRHNYVSIVWWNWEQIFVISDQKRQFFMSGLHSYIHFKWDADFLYYGLSFQRFWYS